MVRPALWCAVPGLALIVLHAVLVHVGVGAFGRPTDIGGGPLLLLALFLSASTLCDRR